MRFGLDIAQQRMPWREVADRARFADELGFDGIWGFDHFQPMYGDGPGRVLRGQRRRSRRGAASPSACASGLLVTGMTYRHPSVFAAEAITIDHASGRPARAVATARRGSTRSTTSSASRSRR